MSRETTLWIFIAAAPVVWFVQQEANFAISPDFCKSFNAAIPLLISVAALFGTVFMSTNAWRTVRVLAHRPPDDTAPSIALASGAALINAGAAVVILAQLIPPLMFARCS